MTTTDLFRTFQAALAAAQTARLENRQAPLITVAWRDRTGAVQVERVLVNEITTLAAIGMAEDWPDLPGDEPVVLACWPNRPSAMAIPLRQVIEAWERRPAVAVERQGLLVTVHSRDDVEHEMACADALISINGPTAREVLIPFGVYTRGGICRLEFDDVAVAMGKWRPCDEAQLRQALAFARGVAAGGAEHLAVHCRQGRSRSAGVTLAILADLHGPGREADAVAELLAQDPLGIVIQPQPGIVRLADQVLGRGGAIQAALEAASPLYLSWKAYWQRKAAEMGAGRVGGISLS